jgi:hypothetical protein
LADDDIQAMNALYGAKISGGVSEEKTTTEPPTAAAAVSPAPGQPTDEICSPDFQMDAIFATEDRVTYVFSGAKYWRLSQERGSSQLPGQLPL